MKVLHLISGGDKGGAKTHVFALLSALAEDIDVCVVCFMEGIFYQEIQNMPIKSMLIKQKFRYDLTVIKKLVDHINKQNYDIIHAHGARANFIAMFLKLYIKKPIITTVHSDYKLDFTQNLYKKILFTELNSISLRFMDYYIAVSKSFKEMLIKRGFEADNIYTVYNAIDFDKKKQFITKKEFMEKYGIDCQEKTIVGIIGRFDKVKGHDIFIQAVSHIVKVEKNILFLLAGEGEERQYLESLSKKIGVFEYIRFLGFVEDIYSFINAIDINVLSSHSESFPYVLLEGAYLKKPTVSTAVGGIPDLIIDSETGYLAKPSDPISLAQKIMTMLNNKQLSKTLGENLYKHAYENFSKQGLKTSHIYIYNQVLNLYKLKLKNFDVILSGYYGYKNSGDEAILDAIIQNLKKEKEDIKILVLSKKPKYTKKMYNVCSINRYNFFSIFKYFKDAKLFINGGGSLLQDVTSTHSLMYYTFLMHLAKYFKLKVMLYSNGIGPIIKKRNKIHTKKALEICDYISLRDPQSVEEIKKLGFDSQVVLSADPTFNIKSADSEIVQKSLEDEYFDPNSKYYGISLRQWKYNDIEFSTKIANIIDIIYKKFNMIPMFIPMQYPQDKIISNEVVSKINCKYIIINKEHDVRVILGIISKLEFVVSMRLHTLIYAVNMKIPVVGIVYDPKTEYFLNYIDQKKYVDTKKIDVDKLLNMVDNIIKDKGTIRNQMAIQLIKLRKVCEFDSKAAVSLIKSWEAFFDKK